MKLRRFVASDMRAALALIKAELGSDAVIMSNKRLEDGIEIVAGYEEESTIGPKTSTKSSANGTIKASRKKDTATTLNGYIDDALDDDDVAIGGRASSALTSQHGSKSTLKTKADRTPISSTAKQVDVAPSEAKISEQVSQEKAANFAKSLMEILERQQRTGSLPSSRSVQNTTPKSVSASSKKKASSKPIPPAPLSAQSGISDFIRERERLEEERLAKLKKVEEDHGISSYDEGSPKSSKDLKSASELELNAMREEIAGLRKLLQYELAGLMRDHDARTQPVRAMLQEILCSGGMDRKLAFKLCGKINNDASVNFAWRELSELMNAHLKVGTDEIIRKGGVVALIGPAGVGKTTTLAKLAARFVIAYGPDKVALITSDNYRIGATEQLKTYARIMGCESYAIKSIKELPKLLLCLKDKSLVLLDTAGVGLHDERFSTQLAELKSQKKLSIRHYLVLPATVRRQVLEEAYDHFSPLGLKGLILTKTDESSTLMDALSLCLSKDLTLSYVTDGQKVPEDLKVPVARSIVSQALMSLETETVSSAIRTD